MGGGELIGCSMVFRDVDFGSVQATRGYHFFGEPLIARGGLYNLCWCGPPAEGSLQGWLKNLGLENGVDVGNSSNGYPISLMGHVQRKDQQKPIYLDLSLRHHSSTWQGLPST